MSSEDQIIRGVVGFRSSRSPEGPPGESEIQRLNPNRVELILGMTGWERLEAGSLNVECDQNVLIDVLDSRDPDLFEHPDSITYPSNYAHIPKLRKGYRYWHAIVSSYGKSEPCLVRRAVNPLKTRIELFAPVSLCETLNLNDRDEVLITLSS